jgi:hypothetical protein
MEQTTTINNIITQIRLLEVSEQRNLLEILQRVVPDKHEQTNSIHITSLNGLGSEIWQQTEVDRYIERERKWD